MQNIKKSLKLVFKLVIFFVIDIFIIELNFFSKYITFRFYSIIEIFFEKFFGKN